MKVASLLPPSNLSITMFYSELIPINKQLIVLSSGYFEAVTDESSITYAIIASNL